MNITDFLFEMKHGRRRVKPQMIMIGIVVSFLVFVVFFLQAQRQAAKTSQSQGPFVTQKAMPARKLDYQIVKVDTIPFSRPSLPGNGTNAPPPLTPAQKPDGQARIPAPERSVRSAPQQFVAPPPSATNVAPASGGFGQGSDMIVVSTLDQRQGGAAAIGSLTGLQSVRLKVIVPDRTPVTNGSLVEVRVMKDDRLGNVEIPRRSQLLGFCSLQNNRVQIDFREIRIKDVTHTCSGRAYDLKLLPGIPYLPLDVRAKQAILDELKSAASGIPFVGRYVNQSDINPLTDEVTTLDEGLEMYVLVYNIY
jgi:hypothetical protein